MTWVTNQTDSNTIFAVPPTLYVWSTPPTTIDVNQTYNYVWYATTDNLPLNVTFDGDATFLHCGETRLYGVPTVPGNYTVSLMFQDQLDIIYQNYTLTVIGQEGPTAPPVDDRSFQINTNDLLLWGTVLFIPIGIVFLFSMLTRNSRR